MYLFICLYIQLFNCYSGSTIHYYERKQRGLTRLPLNSPLVRGARVGAGRGAMGSRGRGLGFDSNVMRFGIKYDREFDSPEASFSWSEMSI